VTFAVGTAVAELSPAASGAIDVREFSLMGGNAAQTRVSVAGHRVLIQMH